MDNREPERTANRLTRRRFLAMSAGVLSTWALVACSPQSQSVASAPTGTAAPKGPGPAATSSETVAKPSQSLPAAKRRLRIGTSFSVTSLDPITSNNWLVTFGALQTLNAITPDQKIVPWIAQSMERNGDEGWTLRINPGAKFHGGKAIDAKAIVGCFERCMERGAAVPSMKEAKYDVIDGQTVRIKTSRPDPWLPTHLVSSRNFPIFDSDVVPAKAGGSDLSGKDYMSGAFKPTSLTAELLQMDAALTPWDGSPKLSGVDVRFIVDAQARLSALKTGEIDMMLYPPADAISQIKSTPGLTFKATPGPGRVFWYLNHKRPPFDDAAVRKACALGIDRKQIAESVLNGLYEGSDSWYPSFASWRVANIHTDTAEAKRLLEEAGWTMGSDGIRRKANQRLSFEFYHYPQQPDSKPMAEAIQVQLKALGMEVRLKQSDDILSTWRSKTFDSGVTFYDMMTAGNPAVRLERSFHTKGAENYGAWGSEELDRVIEQLVVEFDSAKQKDLLQEAQRILDRDVPFTFVVGRQWSTVVNSDFANYIPSVENDLYIVTKDTAPVG